MTRKYTTAMAIETDEDPATWSLQNFYWAVENGEASIASRSTRESCTAGSVSSARYPPGTPGDGMNRAVAGERERIASYIEHVAANLPSSTPSSYKTAYLDFAETIRAGKASR